VVLDEFQTVTSSPAVLTFTKEIRRRSSSSDRRLVVGWEWTVCSVFCVVLQSGAAAKDWAIKTQTARTGRRVETLARVAAQLFTAGATPV